MKIKHGGINFKTTTPVISDDDHRVLRIEGDVRQLCLLFLCDELFAKCFILAYVQIEYVNLQKIANFMTVE